MFDALLENALKQIEIVEVLLTEHDSYAHLQSPERERLVKQYAAASCVTRLYAIYEHFVESLITDYLDAIPELLTYASLPNGLKEEYRMGISHVLGKLNAGRYEHLTHENVIRWYHEALSGVKTYRFVAEALTRHDQNLRLSVLESLMKRIDLNELRSWLANCPFVVYLYQEQSAVVEQLESEIKELVQIRNDAAHGVLENLPGINILERYCVVIRAVLRSLAAYCHLNLLQRLANAGRMLSIGRVTEVFERAGAFIAQLDSGVEIRVGMTLHFKGRNFCAVQEVSSLRVNDVAANCVVAPKATFEVGVGCTVLPRKHAEIYRSNL
jgi:MAE_28990/MAE_18760-like HEPN